MGVCKAERKHDGHEPGVKPAEGDPGIAVITREKFPCAVLLFRDGDVYTELFVGKLDERLRSHRKGRRPAIQSTGPTKVMKPVKEKLLKMSKTSWASALRLYSITASRDTRRQGEVNRTDETEVRAEK